MRLTQPHAGRVMLSLVFAVAFLINGGLGLWIGLTASPQHLNGLSTVIFIFGLASLATAIYEAKRGWKHHEPH